MPGRVSGWQAQAAGYRYCAGSRLPLPSPTDDTLKLARAALWALKRIYQPGYRYQKAAVMLCHLAPRGGWQAD